MGQSRRQVVLHLPAESLFYHFDKILKSFSKSARREIRAGEEADITVLTQGRSEARDVYATPQERYDQQDKGFRLLWEFVRDLLEALNERARVYVAESGDGEFFSGIIIFYSNNTDYL